MPKKRANHPAKPRSPSARHTPTDPLLPTPIPTLIEPTVQPLPETAAPANFSKTVEGQETTARVQLKPTHIAVIGDVGTDWMFISHQSSRSTGVHPHPWTQYPSTTLFAVPGGAWFSGHLVQGALSAPVFHRLYVAHIKQTSDGTRQSVSVSGTFGWHPTLPPLHPDPFEISVLFDDAIPASDRPRLIIDDSMEVGTDQFASLIIRIRRHADLSHSVLELGVVAATLTFEQEDRLQPGRVKVDQLGRVFRAESVQIQPRAARRKDRGKRLNDEPDGFDCTFLTLQNVAFEIICISHPGSKREPGDDSHRPLKGSSLRIVPNAVRSGVFGSTPALSVTTNTFLKSLFLKKAVIDITFGQLEIRNRLFDAGKLTTDVKQYAPAFLPMAQSVMSDAATAEQRARPSHSGQCDGSDTLLPVSLVSLRCDDMATDGKSPDHVESLPNLRRPEPLGGNHRLWFYANPGASISMQHPSHVVHSLSEIGLSPGLKAVRGAKLRLDPDSSRVYRRTRLRGVNGPMHGLPTILRTYRHHTCANYIATVEKNGATTYSSDRDSDPGSDWMNACSRRIVVVDDSGYGFCTNPQLWSPFLCSPEIASKLLDRSPLTATELQSASDYLQNTWIVLKCSHWLNLDDRHLLTFLDKCNATDRCVLIVSGESLRTGFFRPEERPGIKLSRTVSWERTLDDFKSALLEGKLATLTLARDVIVRLGLEGAIHFRRSERNAFLKSPPSLPQNGEHVTSEPSRSICGSLSLHFDPERIEGEYAPADEFGEFPGITSVFSAAIARGLARGAQGLQDADDLQIKNAIQCARRCFDIGYGPSEQTVRKFEHLQLPVTQVFGFAPLDCSRNSGFARIETICFEIVNAGQERAQQHSDSMLASTKDLLGSQEAAWSILTERLEQNGTNRSQGASGQLQFVSAEENAAASRGMVALRLSRDIVKYGSEVAIARSQLAFPYARFGELLTVDRREIEGFRGLRNLFKEYVGHAERRVPLSVAVFGPPGSGKSFGVRQIAQQVAPNADVREFVFNLSQLSDYRELSPLLLLVRDAAIDDKLPLLFFDEFDTTLHDQPLGWLRYFLSPMQDGRFLHDGAMLGLGKAIFVFAGGIAKSHSEFESDSFWASRFSSNSTGGIFSSAKGPDFHSRLRGFLEVVGPNPSGDEDPGEHRPADHTAFDNLLNQDFSYLVRRAILVRQIIERMARTSEPALLDIENRVEVDEDVLDALLLTVIYKHGVRSLEAIIEMSGLHGERTFSKSALPSSAQCLMHVDESFFSILRRNYFRLPSPILRTICIASKNNKLNC